MALELACYGGVIGWLFSRLARRGVRTVLYSLLPAMLVGRLVWGLAQLLLLGVGEGGFTSAAFLAGALTGAIPGILLQLLLIPALMLALDKMRVVSLYSNPNFNP